MKRTFFYLFILLLPVCLQAQPVLNNAEDYPGGDIFFYTGCKGAEAGPSGANQFWDFSGVTDVADHYYYAQNTATPFEIAFQRDSNGTYMLDKGNDVSPQTLLKGRVGPNTVISYVPGSLRMKRPMHYQDQGSNSFDVTITRPNKTFTGKGECNIEADAWGTIKTPSGTYENVLRVKVNHMERDTYAFVITQNVNLIYYLWYNETYRAPIFAIDSIITNGFYGDSSGVYCEYLLGGGLKTAELNKGNQTKAYFGQNSDLYVEDAVIAGKKYEAELHSINGQKVWNSSTTANGNVLHMQMNMSLPQGAYILSLWPQQKGEKPIILRVMKN